jgi:mRNA interferase MazF
MSEHTKNFDGWNEAKKALELKNEAPNFQFRQVWWCSLGVNVGFEADGKSNDFERPVLILRKFNKFLFIGLPLTTQIKQGEYYYDMPEWNGQKGQALLSQIRVMSAKRLNRYMYRVTEVITDEINDKIYELNKAKPLVKPGESRRTNVRLCSDYSKPNIKSQAFLGDKTKRSKK